MAKYTRRIDLVESSLCYQVFGKRLCDCSESERKEYFKIRKQESRKKEHIKENEKEYRKRHWQELKLIKQKEGSK